MSSVRLVKNEDKNLWDAYVEQHTQATPYHRFAWVESVKKAYGHQFFAWIALDENNKICGVLPTSLIKPPLSAGKLSALPFCDVGGAIADDKETEQALLNAAIKHCKDNNILTLEHRHSYSQEENTDELLTSVNKVRMILPLPENSDVLFTNFKSKLRSQVRKAEKNGLTASTGRDSKHLEGFYQVFARNMRDLGSPVHSKKWFEQILANYQDNIIIANVYKDDVVIGAGILLFNGNKCSIPWASTNADYNKLAPNMQLYWTLLAFATDKGSSEFDFGRSTLGEGTYKFKQQWGAVPLALNWQTFKSGQLQTDVVEGSSSKVRGYVETLWKKLPVSTSVAIGPNIRKYISL